MSCYICLRDDFTNYTGSDISWSYVGYSTTQDGTYSDAGSEFDESCMSGPNPCFDSSTLVGGFYKYEYTKDGVTDEVILYVGTPEEAGNPVSNAFCYQGLPENDPDGQSINLIDYFLDATKYNISYVGGELSQYQGTLLEISSLPAGEYCFINTAEKEYPPGFDFKQCVDCDDMETTCIEIVEPLNAGDNRVIEVCNNVTEILFEDYLVNNEGVGTFSVLENNLTSGTILSDRYEPEIDDAGTNFKIVHLLPHPLAENCVGSAILEFQVIDCVPEPTCPDETLGVSITESTNGSPTDAQWEDLLTITKTGTYADAGIIDTDVLYFSNDDGDTWIQGSEVKDDDYYVKLTSGFDTDCGATPSHEMINITLTNGENVDEGEVLSRDGTFNNSWTDISPTDELQVTGTASALITERFFRWDVRHTLNSGWQLHLFRTHFDRGSSDGSCPNGDGAFGDHTYSGHKSGKRKILVERRITYNNGCEEIIIPAEFNPTLPDCAPVPSSVGFDITDPYESGGSEYTGSIECSGSMAGSTSDKMYVYEQPTGSNGFSEDNFNCGGSDYLYFNYSYFFVRIINFADCPPVILTHDYNAPTSCTTAEITCTKDNANSRAKAEAVNTPANLSSQYYEYKRGGGSWQPYTPGQWIYVTGQTTVSFRRVANYNNGCAQTTDTCSTTVQPPTHSLSISCANDTTIGVSASNMPPGGIYRLYRDGFYTQSNSNGADFTISQNGSYKVEYHYNQYQEIHSNTVTCGVDPGCDEPTVVLGACSVDGNDMTIPFTTTHVDDISDITASVTPGSGSMTWHVGSQQGTISVTGQPGTSYTYDIDVVNSCGSDSDSTVCNVSCTNLSISDIDCDFENSRTYFSVYLSPDQPTRPDVTGGTYLGSSGNKYDFYVSGTSGTINADHDQACSPASASINCTCNDPVISLNANCNTDTISYSFTVSNEANTSGNYVVKNNGSQVHTKTNTGAGSYSGTISVAQGSNNSVTVEVDSDCGGTVTSNAATANCGCNAPQIAVNASCSTTTVNYSFSVTNEAQVTGNYEVWVNGSNVDTVTETGAGNYAGSYSVTAGSNNTVQIKTTSLCGNVSSNTSSANCGCPSSSLSISNVSCNSQTQVLTFDINQVNVSGTTLTVNGSAESITANPQTVQGVSGNNTIAVSGTDSCSSDSLSDQITTTCGCDEPSVSLTASCNNAGLITYSFTVTDENRVNGNYSLLIDGTSQDTITNTGSGTYNGTYQATYGTNYTVRIEVTSDCGNQIFSNTVNTSCGCPSESIEITGVSCNSSNQMITFSVNETNATTNNYYVNGVSVAGAGTYQGIVGSNTIDIDGTGDCTGNFLTDTYNITCACTNTPTVQIDSMSESSGVLTVNFSTTNITNTGQITFKGNGTTRSVTNLGSGNWRASFSLNEGNNTITIDVVNNCGSSSDNDTYTYSTCVTPSLTYLTEQCGDGYLYVYTNAENIGHSDITTTPASVRYGSGSSLTFRFNYGTGNTINWDIDGSTDCGTVNINGTSNLCPEVEILIVDEGCSGTGCADYMFLIDNSGSISASEFDDVKLSVQKTIDEIEATAVDARYAIIQYIDSTIDVTVDYTSNAATAKSFNRNWSSGNDNLNGALGQIWAQLDFGINPRSGCIKHLIIFTDAVESDSYGSHIYPFTNRNNLSGYGFKITVVKYAANQSSFPDAKQLLAATATVGEPYRGIIYPNASDPEGSKTDPRRFYFRSSFDGQSIPGLVAGITQNSCQLKAHIGGCVGHGTFSWTTSGGSILAGQNTDTITTNGSGSYTVTVSTQGCSIQETYNY